MGRIIALLLLIATNAGAYEVKLSTDGRFYIHTTTITYVEKKYPSYMWVHKNDSQRVLSYQGVVESPMLVPLREEHTECVKYKYEGRALMELKVWTVNPCILERVYLDGGEIRWRWVK